MSYPPLRSKLDPALSGAIESLAERVALPMVRWSGSALLAEDFVHPLGLTTSHSSHSREWLVSPDCTLTLMDPNKIGATSVDGTDGLRYTSGCWWKEVAVRAPGVGGRVAQLLPSSPARCGSG